MQHMRMVAQDGRAVRNADECGATLPQACIQGRFIGAVERTGRFVENDNARRMNQHARKSDALLFADRQHFFPVVHRGQAAHALGQVGQGYLVQDLL